MLVEPLRIPATDGYPLAATLYRREDGRPAGGETADRLRSL